MVQSADWVMVGWGTNIGLAGDPKGEGRVSTLIPLMHDEPLLCVGMTKDGHPKHPLRVAADTAPEVWTKDPRLAGSC
jgi:hypothetical protein